MESDPPPMTINGPWKTLLRRFYGSLKMSDPVQTVDLIFVMAGRIERKQYGLELFRSGVAPRLVLSIGRFEVSKMGDIDLEGLVELKTLRDKTLPDERHFFSTVDASGVRPEKVNLPRWNTYGEVLALRKFLNKDSARRVMIISTDVHLRRVALSVGKVFHDLPFQFSYCSVPFRLTSLNEGNWWIHRASCRFVVSEFIKLVGYRIILSMPVSIAHPLLRLKD